jgi:organic radical activating enzyme
MRLTPHFTLYTMIKLEPSRYGRNFCYAPWTNIHINPQGTYKTCCGGDVGLADLRKVPIQSIMNSAQLLEIKQHTLSGQSHNNCKQCVRQESMSSASERSWYDDIADRKPIEIESIEQQHIQNLDIRWSNTCNLSCTYCGADASSQWASHKKIPVERLDYSDTLPSLMAFIAENKSTIKNLGLLGGEPLLQKENESLLDVIDQDVHINVITNLTVPLENNKIFKKLMEKNRVVWDISFDTVGDKFEYVRRGSTWDNILNNIRYLQHAVTQKPNHIVGVAAVYSVYNALELSNIHQYFNNNNLPVIRWNELHAPSELSVQSLPERFRLQAADQLEQSVPHHVRPRQQAWLAEMAANLRNVSNANNNCDYLYDWHLAQENQYWPNFEHKFANLWPEYRT